MSAPGLKFIAYSKTCLKWPLSKRRQKLGLQDQLSLMQVKSIAESILQNFRPSLS